MGEPYADCVYAHVRRRRQHSDAALPQLGRHGQARACWSSVCIILHKLHLSTTVVIHGRRIDDSKCDCYGRVVQIRIARTRWPDGHVGDGRLVNDGREQLRVVQRAATSHVRIRRHRHIDRVVGGKRLQCVRIQLPIIIDSLLVPYRKCN